MVTDVATSNQCASNVQHIRLRSVGYDNIPNGESKETGKQHRHRI